MENGEPPQQRICVIGSGIAGLTTAFLLSRKGHDVTLLERENEIGMDAHGVSGICGSSADTRIDVPLRVFSRTYYPNLVQLYRLLHLEIIDADYSFSCSGFTRGSNDGDEGGDDDDDCAKPDAPLFGYNRRGWFVFPQWSSLVPNFRAAVSNAHLLAQLVSLLFRAEGYVRSGDAEGTELGEFLRSRGFSERFKAALFYPMLSVVCTCSYASIDKYPATVALEYFAKHGVFNWPWAKTCQCRVVGGVRKVARTLCEPVARVRLGIDVLGVLTTNPGDKGGSGKPVVSYVVPEIDSRSSGPSSSPPAVAPREVREAFDHVVIATQAHQALNLLSAPHKRACGREFESFSSGSNTAVGDVAPIPCIEEYQRSLGGFKYERSRVVVHRDPRLMPTSRRQWSPLNILVPGVSDPASTANASSMPMCSVWMTKIDARVSSDVYQTWNPLLEPRGEIFADGEFERPVVSTASARCMKDLDKLQGKSGIHFVGAYALHAVPLLENGVHSAMRAAERIDGKCRAPWASSESGKARKDARSWLILAGLAVVGGGGAACLIARARARN
jgi:predicted NAD/FAD-binding protein